MKNVDSTPDLVLTWTCISCPTIIEGTVGGHKIFYRERHQRWWVEVDDLEVANGTCEIREPLSADIARIVDAIWHPHIAESINAREDALHEGHGS